MTSPCDDANDEERIKLRENALKRIELTLSGEVYATREFCTTVYETHQISVYSQLQNITFLFTKIMANYLKDKFVLVISYRLHFFLVPENENKDRYFFRPRRQSDRKNPKDNNEKTVKYLLEEQGCVHYWKEFQKKIAQDETGYFKSVMKSFDTVMIYMTAYGDVCEWYTKHIYPPCEDGAYFESCEHDENTKYLHNMDLFLNNLLGGQSLRKICMCTKGGVRAVHNYMKRIRADRILIDKSSPVTIIDDGHKITTTTSKKVTEDQAKKFFQKQLSCMWLKCHANGGSHCLGDVSCIQSAYSDDYDDDYDDDDDDGDDDGDYVSTIAFYETFLEEIGSAILIAPPVEVKRNGESHLKYRRISIGYDWRSILKILDFSKTLAGYYEVEVKDDAIHFLVKTPVKKTKLKFALDGCTSKSTRREVLKCLVSRAMSRRYKVDFELWYSDIFDEAKLTHWFPADEKEEVDVMKLYEDIEKKVPELVREQVQNNTDDPGQILYLYPEKSSKKFHISKDDLELVKSKNISVSHQSASDWKEGFSVPNEHGVLGNGKTLCVVAVLKDKEETKNWLKNAAFSQAFDSMDYLDGSLYLPATPQLIRLVHRDENNLKARGISCVVLSSSSCEQLRYPKLPTNVSFKGSELSDSISKTRTANSTLAARFRKSTDYSWLQFKRTKEGESGGLEIVDQSSLEKGSGTAKKQSSLEEDYSSVSSESEKSSSSQDSIEDSTKKRGTVKRKGKEKGSDMAKKAKKQKNDNNFLKQFYVNVKTFIQHFEQRHSYHHQDGITQYKDVCVLSSTSTFKLSFPFFQYGDNVKVKVYKAADPKVKFTCYRHEAVNASGYPKLAEGTVLGVSIVESDLHGHYTVAVKFHKKTKTRLVPYESVVPEDGDESRLRAGISVEEWKERIKQNRTHE